MIDFACRRFELEEIIRCGLNLTKADFNLLEFLMKNSQNEYSTSDIAKKLNLDLSTIQRSIKKIYDKNFLTRSQINLHRGYVFLYRIKSKKIVKDLIMSIINNWVKSFEDNLKRW